MTQPQTWPLGREAVEAAAPGDQPNSIERALEAMWSDIFAPWYPAERIKATGVLIAAAQTEVAILRARAAAGQGREVERRNWYAVLADDVDKSPVDQVLEPGSRRYTTRQEAADWARMFRGHSMESTPVEVEVIVRELEPRL